MRQVPPSRRVDIRFARYFTPLVGAGALALLTSLALTASTTQTQLYTSALASARVSTVTSSQLVITLDATGDLRGSVTLKLDLAADGTIAGGDWALVSSFVEDLNPDGSVADPEAPEEPEDPNVPDEERIRLVDNGTLGGSVLGGTIALGADGAVTIAGIQLALTSGTLTFASITAGAGDVDLDLTQPGAQGTLRLTF